MTIFISSASARRVPVVTAFLALCFFAHPLSIAHAEDTPAYVGMAYVKGGCFDMGDLHGDGDRDELPVHKVCLSDYYLDRHEVTNVQFEVFMPSFAYSREAVESGIKISPADDTPVIGVTWEEAKGYCEQMGKRLPTEAEWEYAARSGGKRYHYPWGDGRPNENIADDATLKVFKDLEAWEGYNDGYATTAPVGSFPPNELGLYDMGGNVWEWVTDRYDGEYYTSSTGYNPRGPRSGAKGVIRGACWDDGQYVARSSFRFSGERDDRKNGVGIRCAVSAEPEFGDHPTTASRRDTED